MASSKSSGWSEIGLSRSRFSFGASCRGRRRSTSDLAGSAAAVRALALRPRPLRCMGGSSASCHDRPEHVGVVAVVMTEREFVEVQRQILLAHLVVGPDDAALQEAPERLD